MDESEIKGVVLPAYEEWAQQRNQMIEVCGECHSRLFVREKMREIDAIIMKADRIMADAIEIVRALYREGLLPKPKENPPSFPDLLGFYKAPNPLEEKLSTMFLKYRLIMLHGAFHNNPDFTANDGWVKLRKGFDEIQRMALELRNAGE